MDVRDIIYHKATHTKPYIGLEAAQKTHIEITNAIEGVCAGRWRDLANMVCGCLYTGNIEDDLACLPVKLLDHQKQLAREILSCDGRIAVKMPMGMGMPTIVMSYIRVRYDYAALLQPTMPFNIMVVVESHSWEQTIVHNFDQFFPAHPSMKRWKYDQELQLKPDRETKVQSAQLAAYRINLIFATRRSILLYPPSKALTHINVLYFHDVSRMHGLHKRDTKFHLFDHKCFQTLIKLSEAVIWATNDGPFDQSRLDQLLTM